jgi:thiol-disulfide isomerase/thioredoxin
MKRALPFFLLAIGLFSIGLAMLWRVLIHVDSPGALTAAESERACVQPAALQFPAPNLELTDLAGNTVRLEDYQGQVVLLNTWASWCPPCRAEMPDLKEYYERHKSEGFTVLAVNIGESSTVVSEFQQQAGLTFPVWLDPQEKSLRALNTVSLPYSIVIDPTGEVQFAWSGATCLSRLESSITPLFQ